MGQRGQRGREDDSPPNRMRTARAGPGARPVRRFDLESEPQQCKRRLGVLPAGNSGLYARLTTRQQLEFWCRLAFVPPHARERAVLGAIERFGLTALAESRLDRISMGERQRVRLAMAFLHAPDLVLLDEPRTSLDAAGLARLVEAIEDLRSRGGSALWCSPSGDAPPAGSGRQAARASRAIGTGVSSGIELRDAVIAVFRRDALLFWSYRTRVVSQTLAVFFSLTVFYYVSKLVKVGEFPSADAYFSFVAVGIVTLAVLTATMTALPLAVRQELTAGTFERFVVSPIGAAAGVAAMLIFPMLSALTIATFQIVLAAIVFPLDVHWSTAALAMPVVLLGALSFAPFAADGCRGHRLQAGDRGRAVLHNGTRVRGWLHLPGEAAPGRDRVDVGGPAVHAGSGPAAPSAGRHAPT